VIERDLSIAGDFPPTGYDAWKAKAQADLKGVPFDKLVGHTDDGIALQPLYTAESRPSAGDPSGFPGSLPFIRGMTPVESHAGGWDVRTEVAVAEPAAANAGLLEDLRNGATSVDLRLDAAARAGLDPDDPAATGLCGREGLMAYACGDLGRALQGVRFDETLVSLDAGPAFLPAAALLAAVWQERGASGPVRGAFNADPLGALLRDGGLPVPLETALVQMADLAAWTAHHLPGVTAVRVSTAVHHDAGSGSVQDLAFAVATAVEYLRAMTARDLEPDAAVQQIAFHMTLGCRFFQSIAKLRALRALWGRVVEVCGVDPEAAARTRVVVEISRRVITHRAPWVNLLRNTAVCFAGAVGGADAVITLPMDAALGGGDALSRRLACTTQAILREECRLGEVLDPAGGSWYLEKLTGEMAEQAWAVFREIEGLGGMAAAVTSGWVAERIVPVEQHREKDIATRRAAITGVSAHPDVFEEEMVRPAPVPAALREAATGRLVEWRRGRRDPDPCAELRETADGPGGGRFAAAAVAAARAGATIGEMTVALAGPAAARRGARIEPLPARPYAAAYEQLRDLADAYAEAHGGGRPKVFLARLGAPKEYLTRATWAQDFVEAGGFEPVTAEGAMEAQAAACAASGAVIAVICSSDARYATDVEGVAPRLRAAGARVVVLAGNPGSDEARYRAAGVDRFIFVRCDVLGTLRALLREVGVL
jgi:methylmalonyl-CoA mutase